MRRWTFIPWLGGLLFLIGPMISQARAVVFYRSLLVAVVATAVATSFAAARSFERGDLLHTTWLILACAYVLLAIRYVMRLLVSLNAASTPVTFDRALLILHNVLVPVALFLFVRAWRKTGLTGPMSGGAAIASILAGIVVALVIGAYPLMHSQSADFALVVSTIGDMIGIALIVPLLMPAIGMRGGLLMYTWLYLALAQVAWLLYDIWSVARTRTGVNAAWGLAADQALRAVALLYICGAAVAQRRAIARTIEIGETTAQGRLASA